MFSLKVKVRQLARGEQVDGFRKDGGFRPRLGEDGGGQADRFAKHKWQQVAHFLTDLVGESNRLQGIEIINVQPLALAQEFGQLVEQGPSPGQKHFAGRLSLLEPLVGNDRAGNFLAKSGRRGRRSTGYCYREDTQFLRL